MKQYLDLLQDIKNNGTLSEDRTGTGTKSIFGHQMRFDLSKGFPLLTTKRVFWKGVVIELLWLMSGQTNIKFLQKHGVKIWDEWADENGDLGPVYGKQWRRWEVNESYSEPDMGKRWMSRTIDQLKIAIASIKNSPHSRRIIVSAWNPAVISQMALPPCHCFFQFYVRDGKLSCQLYQRSADVFLGVPFNIASYALLTHLIANECGLKVGDFIHTFGDVHIYNNHMTQVNAQLERIPRGLPSLSINVRPGELFELIDKNLNSLSWGDIKSYITLTDYSPHPSIRAEVSV